MFTSCEEFENFMRINQSVLISESYTSDFCADL